MKRKILTAVVALLLVAGLSAGVWASTDDVQAWLAYRDIKITLNGQALEPKNALGETVEPFIIDGTTYLPVRAISEALGLDVQWDSSTNTVVLNNKAAPQQDVYRIGETWTVPGQWSLTITGVKETEDRNGYSSKTPAAVYVIDYEYTNLGYEHNILDGLFISLSDTIVDSAGQMGYSYPGQKDYYAQMTPIGATCYAQEVIGVDNAGAFQVIVSMYDSNRTRQRATFALDVS